MTMIAYTYNGRAPIIMGDILISSDQKPDSFILPSRNQDILNFLGENVSDHPFYLKRKIYIPKSNICVAFAGDENLIKNFLEDLVIYCNSQPDANRFDIASYLEQYGLLPDQDISLFMLVADIVDDKFETLEIKRG